MTDKTKKIIAREGLVILACLVCAAISIFIASLIPYQPIPCRYSISTGGHTHIFTTDSYQSTFSDADKTEIMASLKSKFPKEFTYGKIDFIPNDLTIKYIGQNYQLKDHIRNVGNNFGIFFLISAYPIYLITRFIIWAIRTLKENQREG